MPARCFSCQTPVRDGVELCEDCRTARVLKVDLDSLDGPAAAQLRTSVALPERSLGEAIPFCGRAPELDRLLGLLAQTLAARKLHCAVVYGAPGLGKSRLLDELRQRCMDSLGLPSDRILCGVMSQDAASPVSALSEQLRNRFDIAPGEQVQSAREKILRTCRMLLSAVRATEVAHCLGEFLGVPFPDSQVQVSSLDVPRPGCAASNASGEPRTYVALKRFLLADAARAPLVLLFDEMEQANDETLSLLHYLFESLVEVPVFVGVFARPEFLAENPDCGSSTGTVTRIELSPMPPHESVALFRAALGQRIGDVPAELLQKAEQCGQESPRKVVELSRLFEEAQAWAKNSPSAPLGPMALPAQLDMESLVTARLAVLPEPARALLEKAAVYGERFYADALLMLYRCEQAGLIFSGETQNDELDTAPADPEGPALDELLSTSDRATLHEGLSELLAQGLLQKVRDSRLGGEMEYRFAYAPWREIVYHTVDSSRRRCYHLLFAHWLLLHQERDSEEVLEAVARHMERAGRGPAAAFFYRRVAQLLSSRGAYQKAPRLLLRALSCLGSADIGMRVGLWHDLGNVMMHKGDLDAAFGAFEKLLRLAHALALRRQLAQAHHALGQLHRLRGEPSQALEHLNRAFTSFGELADSDGLSDVLDDLGQVLWRLGRVEEALDHAGRSLELRRRLGNRRKEAATLLHIGVIEQHRGLFDSAVGCYEEALRKHDGDPQLWGACLEALGSLELLRGDMQAARARFEQGLSLVEPLAPSSLHAMLLCRLGETLLLQGNLDDAEPLLQSAREVALRLSDPRAQSEIARLLGLLLLRRNQYKAALECCQKALEQAQRNGMRHEVARSLLALGEVHATALFDETAEGAHPAWDCFRRSVNLLREVGDQAELALALYQMGRHLIERGRLSPARSTLREAEQIAAQLQMRVAEQMRQMLAEL